MYKIFFCEFSSKNQSAGRCLPEVPCASQFIRLLHDFVRNIFFID